MDGADDGTTSARRTLAFFVVAVLTLLAGIAVVVLGDETEDPVVLERGEAGPRPGADVAAYVRARRGALAEVEGVHGAVVSFTAYVVPGEAAEILQGLEVSALLVALPRDGARPTSDVDETRDTVRAVAEAQIAEIEQLVPTVDDPEFARFYRAELLRYRAMLAGASQPEVVFGAVVRARASVLRGLASRPSVRLVDLAAGDDVDVSRARGLRPEETLRAGRPPFRP